MQRIRIIGPYVRRTQTGVQVVSPHVQRVNYGTRVVKICVKVRRSR